MKLINIGFGNMINANRMIAVVSPESAPIKRVISDAKEKGFLIDATYGRKTRSVIIFDSGHVVLTYLQTSAFSNRVAETEDFFAEDENEDE